MKAKVINFIEQVKQRRFDPTETQHLLLNSNRSVYMSWGVTNVIYHQNDGLALYVNGHHHDGYVVIILGWDDTYTYYLLNQDYTPKKRVDGVYFDELQYRIDQDIEYISGYKF